MSSPTCQIIEVTHTYSRFHFFNHMWCTTANRCRIIWQGLNFRCDHRRLRLLVNAWDGCCCHCHLSIWCVCLLAIVVLILWNIRPDLDTQEYNESMIYRFCDSEHDISFFCSLVSLEFYLTQWIWCGAIRISDITSWSRTIAIQIFICHRVLTIIQWIRCLIALHRHIFKANRIQQNNNNNKKYFDSSTIEHFTSDRPLFKKCKSFSL